MKQLVADCVVIGACVSNDAVQKIVNIVTTVAGEMIKTRAKKEELRSPNFRCKITTTFRSTKSSGVSGYLFEVKVTYKGSSFTMRLVIKPFKIDGIATHIIWEKESDEVLSVDGSWVKEFLRRESQLG
ncbi:MAG: hypothetical protein AAB470_01080 [Patescibacteria group bacterium]